MGTRSCVMIKVRPSDVGKTLKFDESKLPVKLGNWECKDFNGKVYRDETGKDLCKPVTLEGDYIGVYCHWDGYPHGGVGDALKEAFNDYDKAMSLIIGGSCSAITEENVVHYANRNIEKWEHIKPLQGKTQKSIYDRCGWAEYAYLYDEARGGWVYKDLCRNGSDKRGFMHWK